MLKDAPESRVGGRIDGEYPIARWLVTYAASAINSGRKDHEGFTALRRWRGRELNKPVAEFGERAHYAPAFSAEKISLTRDGSMVFGWDQVGEQGVDHRNTRRSSKSRETFAGSWRMEGDGETVK